MRCEVCKGRGFTIQFSVVAMEREMERCWACNGSGKVIE
jgi:DnaJ-class molecular chaperone